MGNISAMDVELKQDHPARGLLIFLDETEKSYNGAISGELSIALAQKAGPILASASLLKNVFSEYGKDIFDEEYGDVFNETLGLSSMEENENLMKLFISLSKFNSNKVEDRYREEKSAYKYILLKALHFNPHDWIIKKVSDSLFLFIPMAYLYDHHIHAHKAFEDHADQITNTELQLGLKINHMQNATIETILAQQTHKEHNVHYFIEALYNNATQTSDIFCLRPEYINKPIAIPVWIILISGHGHGGARISNIEKDDFKKVLDFLERNIICSLFVYNSCFTGGANIEAIYKDLNNITQKTYSFPIIMHALTDAVVYMLYPILEIDNNGRLSLTSRKRESFANFLQAASQPDVSDYKNIMQYIYEFGPDTKPNEVAQIKLPGLAWFFPLDTSHVVSIGEILVQARDPQAPLNIEKFFKINPSALLLYAPNIPFELQLNTDLKSIVSMIPGDALHTLAKVSSTNKNINEILTMFMKIDMLRAEKIFFIKEMQGTDTTIRDVIIAYIKVDNPYANKDFCTAYYIDGEALFIKSSRNTKTEKIYDLSSDRAKQYQAYLQIATGKPQHITEGVYYENRNWANTIAFKGAALSPRAVIDKIEDINAPLTDIFDAIQYTQRDDDMITLIKEITGINNISVLLNYGTPITVTNVIVDNNNRKIFFTFDGNFYEGKRRLEEDYMTDYIKLLTPTVPFKQHEGSLLPLTIKSHDFEKIKAAIKQKQKN